MKKLLSSLVVLLLLVSCCLIAAFPTSATDINYDDFEIIDGVIIEYLGDGGDVIVPSVDADGNPVTHIDSRAFHQNTDVTSVIICEGIETMGNEVFEFCENLTEVSLPYSLTETGYSVFRKCNLYSLVIPGNLKVVKSDFSVGGPITDIVISPGVEEMSTNCLYGQFTELVLPESVYFAAGIFRGGMTVQVKEWSLYILNPDCELGTLSSKSSLYETYGSVGPLTYGYQGCTCKIKVYGLKDSQIKDYVNEYMVDKMGTVSARFIGLEQDKIDELQAQCEERGITKPTANTMDDDGSVSTGNSNGNGESNTNNTNGGSTSTVGSNSEKDTAGGVDMTVIIIATAAVIIVLLIVVVVVLMVSLNSKKKKRKKRKAAKKTEEAPVIEEVTEEVAEEKGEEE